MVKVLETIDLSYNKFNNINLSFESSNYYLIVGSNNSGKTILFKLLSSFISTKNMIICNDVYLNNNSLFEYIVNLGIVERVTKNSFLYQNVIDEMIYPLYNLGYSKRKIDKRINEILELFNETKFRDKKINDLDYLEKQKLLIMISLLHKPKILLLDSVLEVFPHKEKNEILNIINKLINDGLTVIEFSVSLENIIYANKIILLDNYKIVGEYLPNKVYEDDKVFYDHGLEIPFITDLSIKLKMYDVINKEYFNTKEMVDDIWP